MQPPEIRQALEKLSGAFSAEPAKARAKNAPATAKLTEGLQFEVTGPYNARIVTDMPPAMGGRASAPSPGWLLRAALASCTATVVAMRAAQLGISLDLLEVSVSGEGDARGMLGLDETVSAAMTNIRTRVRIGAEGISSDRLVELVRWAEAHAPVTCAMRNSEVGPAEIEVR